MIDIPSCEWMRDEMCVNADCPMRGDFCPVPDYPDVCRYENRVDDMTPMQAWGNISKRLAVYAREYGFEKEDIKAEVLIFGILKERSMNNGSVD